MDGVASVKAKGARCIVLVLCLLAVMSGCNRSSGSYFPLTPGSRWVYRTSAKAQHRQRPAEKGAGMTVTGTVLSPRPLDGRMVIPFQMDTVGNVSMAFFVEREDGAFMVAKQAVGEKEPEVLEEPACTLPYPPLVGITCDLEETTRYEETEFTMSGTSVVEAVDDTVTVPAGTFHDCLRVKTEKSGRFVLPGGEGRAEMVIEQTEWWVRGVGLVKLITDNHMEPKSLGWGTETMELESFKAG